ncbi:MAG: hypothetical protein ACREQW_07775 [Candidatus Binatia bacterium]
MWILLASSFILFSCSLAPGNLQVRSVDDLRARNIKRIAVLPVDSLGAASSDKSPYGSSTTTQGKSSDNKDPGSLLTDFLYFAMMALPHWQVVSEREVQEMGGTIRGTTAGQARKLGERVYADAVLFGRVVRFRERVGEDLGVSSPASVAFLLQLRDVKRGDIIWTGEYQETQKALSENLFGIGDFTRRGAKWVRAEDLARDGVQKAVEQLNRMLYR